MVIYTQVRVILFLSVCSIYTLRYIQQCDIVIVLFFFPFSLHSYSPPPINCMSGFARFGQQDSVSQMMLYAIFLNMLYNLYYHQFQDSSSHCVIIKIFQKSISILLYQSHTINNLLCCHEKKTVLTVLKPLYLCTDYRGQFIRYITIV